MVKTNSGGEEKKGHVRRLPYRKYGYFRDDQIILLVKHKEKLVQKTALDANVKNLNDALKNKSDTTIQDVIDESIVSPYPRVDTLRRFPKNTEQDNQQSMLSMFTYHVEKAPEDPSYLLRAIDAYNKKLKNNANKDDEDKEKQTNDNPSIESNTEPPENTGSGSEYTIIGASANWLTSVTSQGSAVGGPGGRPSPYHGNCKTAPFGFDDLIARLEDKGLYGEGNGVDVAILDTAPSAQALVAAPKEWPDHPLIKTLLGPEGKLRLYPAPYEEVLHLGNTSLNDHDYVMTDHGLFIAGIVHSLVPQANIHLIEVLNQYGVGDLSSFVRGLGIVLNELYNPERKLVINCSWMLELPLVEQHCHHINQTDSDPDAEFERQVLDLAQNDGATAALLKSLFDEFSTLGKAGKHAIAAAGNDGRKGDTARVKARYPAALENVKGVGALAAISTDTNNRIFRPAVYSNLADTPVPDGIVTLGGEEGEGKGVLGVYIGEFPAKSNSSLWQTFINWLMCRLIGRVTGPRNLTKWAWWCGTSFATPILSGAVAAVLSSQPEITTTEDALNKLYEEKIIAGSTQPGVVGPSQAGEDVLGVTQA